MEIKNIGLVAVTENAAKKVALESGGKIKAVAGTKYLLQVPNTEATPENVIAKRDGQDLQLFLKGSEKPELTLQNFFAEGMDGQLYGVAEDGQLYAYVRTDGAGSYGQFSMSDGESAPIALGGDALGDGAAYQESKLDDVAGFLLWPWLLGAAGIGGVAAITDHNRHSSSKHSGTSSEPTDIKVTDAVGPIQGQLANGEMTDDARPTVTGTGTPGAVIHVYDKGAEIGSTTVDKSGNWSFAPSANLPDGEHTFTVTQVQPGKQPSLPVSVLDFFIDTIPPDAPVATLVGGVENGGVLYSPSKTPTLNGTGEPGDSIIVTLPTGEKLATTVDSAGKWSVTPTQPMPEGAVAITITERDPAGNETTVKLAATIDTLAPDTPKLWLDAASDSGIQGDNLTNATQPTIVGTAEVNSRITITFKATAEVIKATVDANGNWSVVPTKALPEGAVQITATATDAAGNTSPSASLTVTIDTTPPAAPTITGVLDSVGSLTGNIESGGKTDDARPLISGKGVAGDSIIVYTHDATGDREIGRATVGADGTWKLQPATPLVSGLNKLSAVEVDLAGNTSAPSTPYSITLDITPPTAPVIVNVLDDVGPYTGFLQKGAITDDNQPTFSGTAQPASIVKLYDGDKLIGSGQADATGHWSITTVKLADGSHGVFATATNSVGQVSAPTGTWGLTVDTTAPANSTLVVTDNVGAETGPLHDGDTTDDNRPVFTGTAEPHGKVILFDNGKLLGEATVDADGKWVFTLTTPLAGGLHGFTTEVLDQAGNSSGPSGTLRVIVDTSKVLVSITHIVDNVGSITGDIASGGVSDDARPQIHGTGKAGSTVTIKDGNTTLGSVSIDSEGNWSFTPPQPLAEGPHRITAIAVDKAGNSSSSGAFDLTIDTTAPDKPSIDTVYDDVGAIQGLIARGGVTDDSTPTLSGKAEANATVTLYDNGGILGSVTADKDGNWSFTPTTPLNEGQHVFTVTATDKAGNTSPVSDAFGITTDYTPPAAPVIVSVLDSVGDRTGNLASGDFTDDDKPTISGTAEAGSTVVIYDGSLQLGTALTDGSGNWSFTPGMGVGDGQHRITAKAIDAAGNVSDSSNAFDFIFDMPGTQPPVITRVIDSVGSITGDIAKGGVTDDTRPQIQGLAGSASQVTVYIDGNVAGTTMADANGNWSFTPSSSLADGRHEITVKSTNHVGNISPASEAWPLVVDTVAPAKPSITDVQDNVGPITGSIANGGLTDDLQPTLSGTAEAGATVRVYDNGKSLGETTADPSGNWTFRPTSPLSEGQHDFSVTATDAAGNISVKSDDYSIILDYTPPAAPAITGVLDSVGSVTGNIEAGGKTDDTRPLISGLGSKAGNIIILFTRDETGSHEIGRTTVQADGTWSLQPAAVLNNGDNQLTAVEQGAAGNLSAACPPYSIVIDPGQPNPPVIVSVEDDVGPYRGYLQKGDITDDNQPTFRGTAQAGSTVRLYDTDGLTLIGKGIADVSGNWTITTDKLADGLHEVIATATNTIGVLSEPTGKWSFTVDTTAPDNVKNLVILDDVGSVTGALHDADTTDDSRPTFSGMAEPNAKVIIYGNSDKLGEAKVGADGKWTFTPTQDLKDGEYDFVTEVLDEAGNSSGKSSPTHITIDTSEVDIKITRVVDTVGSITGDIAPLGVTDDTRPQIHGTAKPGSTVTVCDVNEGDDYRVVVVLGTTTVQPDGRWTFIPSEDLQEGAHALSAVATDLAGNTSTSANFSFTVDTTAPDKPTIDEVDDDVGAIQGLVANGGTTDDSTPTLWGRAEANAKVIIYDNGGVLGSVMADPGGTWIFTPTSGLSEGRHALTATATDAAGNTSLASDVYVITTDYTSPDAPVIVSVFDAVGDLTGNLNPGDTTDDTRPRISGTAEAGVTVDIYDGVAHLGAVIADTNGNWTFTPTRNLAEGLHSLSAIATDAAGNYSPVSNEFYFTVVNVVSDVPSITRLIDSVGSITGEIAQGGVTDETRPEVKGTAEAGIKVSIYIDGTLAGTATADASGNWTFKPATDLLDGTHRVTAKGTDAAGNTSAASDAWAFTVDTQCAAPVITSILDSAGSVTGELQPGDSTDDARPRISGTAEANSTVEIYDGSLKIGSTVADASGHWSFTPTANLSQGEHSISAQATDVAGNVSPLSSAFGLTVTSLGTSGVEEFDVFNSGGMNWNFPSRFGMLVNSGSASQTKLSGTADVGDLGSTSACISLQGNPAKIQFFIPGDGATAFSLAMGRLGSGPSDHSGGTVTLKAFDAQGVLLDTVVSPSYTDYYHWYTLALKAPANKLIYTIELVSNDPGGILFDHAAWGSAVVTASSALETHTVVESVVAEHADTGALTQALSEPAPAADSRTASSTHEASISPLADTFYGAPAGEVATQQYSAGGYVVSINSQGIHGDGVDTLKLLGGDQTLDLTLPTSQGKLTGIEIVDITGSAEVAGQVSGANTLTLSLKDVLENGQSDLFHATDTHAVQMMVKGDGNDIVNLRDGELSEGRASSWSEQGRVIVGGTSYVVYEPLGRDAELLVQQGVTVNLA